MMGWMGSATLATVPGATAGMRFAILLGWRHVRTALAMKSGFTFYSVAVASAIVDNIPYAH